MKRHDAPSLVEQHGSKSPYRKYFCDASGPRRTRTSGRGDFLANMRKFVKVNNYVCCLKNYQQFDLFASIELLHEPV